MFPSFLVNLYVETEFTYYPDNSPHEYKYRKTVILDKKRDIVNEFPKEALRNNSQKADDFLNV